jgi:hypothetical protein
VYGAGGGDGSQAASWRFYDSLRVLRGGRWEALPALPAPLADACKVSCRPCAPLQVVTRIAGRRRLWLLGGSDFPQRWRRPHSSLRLQVQGRRVQHGPRLPGRRLDPEAGDAGGEDVARLCRDGH